jgi:hypothetical protein
MKSYILCEEFRRDTLYLHWVPLEFLNFTVNFMGITVVLFVRYWASYVKGAPFLNMSEISTASTSDQLERMSLNAKFMQTGLVSIVPTLYMKYCFVEGN